MRSFSWAVAVLPIFAVVRAKTLLQRDLQLHEARTIVPFGYALASPASPDTVLQLRIALVQNNTAGLIDTLYEVSTPESSHYGQYLTKEEVGKK